MPLLASSISCKYARVVGNYSVVLPILAMLTSVAFRKGRRVRELLSSYSAGFPREVDKSFIARRPYSEAKDGATLLRPCSVVEDGATALRPYSEAKDGATLLRLRSEANDGASNLPT